ncbi:MAG: glycoside hydrolase family 2 protein [Anaerolineae bacterium]|jgi:beta-glucuronidase
MLGRYDRTPDRPTIVLDGWWEFCTDPEEQGEGPSYAASCASARPITVPGCWNTELGLHDYHGVAWYRKVFESDFEGAAKLTFGAVADLARVWLNGEYLGEHEGGFTAFSFIAAIERDENELVVRVDNRHSETTLPKDAVDWFPYGGITRPVICEQVHTVFIDRVHIRGAIDGQVDVRVRVRNRSPSPVTVPFSVSVGGQRRTGTVTLAADASQEEQLALRIPDPQLWSLGAPHLYTAIVELGTDLYQERFGLREIRTEGSDILLNGEKIWIRGVNRHEDHPDWGFAQPDKLMQRDIQIIQDLNCNAVRGSHYPNHPTFLDLCDEAGLLFFAELPGWQYSAAQIATEPTKSKLQHMLREMIDEQFNHPCIYTWSMHNECQTEVSVEGDVDLSSAMAELLGLARDLDETRLVTYVSHRYWHDQHLHLADTICLNEYIGWYVSEIEGSDFADYLRRMAELYPDKPILITEFGAGGIAGEHSMAAVKWSEEYQVQQVTSQIEAMRENEHVAGCYIWQYCDIRVHPRRALGRPRSMNNKGLVDEYRRPKSAYYAVRDLFARIEKEG